MRKLFVSFSGLFIAMKAGKITSEDLRRGLFYFGCTEADVIALEGHLRTGDHELLRGFVDHWEHYDRHAAFEAYHMVRAALKFAAMGGRLRWKRGDQPSYAELNEFLAANGFRTLTPKDGGTQFGSYTLPNLDELVREQGLPFEVVIR